MESQKLDPAAHTVMATETSLFIEAAGLKKTGLVGGTGSFRLAGGTRSLVLPSMVSTYLKWIRDPELFR
jgi:hypothetical protein